MRKISSQNQKTNPGKYRLAFAEFYLQDKDYPSALIKYYRLIEDNLESEMLVWSN